MLNKVFIMGRITSPLELKQTPNGKSVTSFSVAIDKGKDKEGKELPADFIPVQVWGSRAEFVTKYFDKGSLILIEGSLRTGTYEKDGQKRFSMNVVADSVSFTGEKSRGNAAPVPTAEAPTMAEPSFDDLGFAGAEDGDVPF